jgi:hypothetical protein
VCVREVVRVGKIFNREWTQVDANGKKGEEAWMSRIT